MAILSSLLSKAKDLASKIFSMSTASHLGTMLLGALIGFFAHAPLHLALVVALDVLDLLRKF